MHLSYRILCPAQLLLHADAFSNKKINKIYNSLCNSLNRILDSILQFYLDSSWVQASNFVFDKFFLDKFYLFVCMGKVVNFISDTRWIWQVFPHRRTNKTSLSRKILSKKNCSSVRGFRHSSAKSVASRLTSDQRSVTTLFKYNNIFDMLQDREEVCTVASCCSCQTLTGSL